MFCSHRKELFFQKHICEEENFPNPHLLFIEKCVPALCAHWGVAKLETYPSISTGIWFLHKIPHKTFYPVPLALSDII